MLAVHTVCTCTYCEGLSQHELHENSLHRSSEGTRDFCGAENRGIRLSCWQSPLFPLSLLNPKLSALKTTRPVGLSSILPPYSVFIKRLLRLSQLTQVRHHAQLSLRSCPKTRTFCPYNPKPSTELRFPRSRSLLIELY